MRSILRRTSRRSTRALTFRPCFEPLEERLTPDSQLLGNSIVTSIGPTQSFTTYTNSAIDQANDIYLYKFQASAGFWFSAQTQTAAGNNGYLTTNLRLFDSTGQEITAQVANNGPSTNVLLDVVIPATGTYYLGLAGGANTAYNPTDGTGAANGGAGHYDLQMSLWQMGGTAGQDRAFTVTGAAPGGNRLEFYPDLTATGAQGANVTVVYHPAGDANTYYAYNPTGVVNYQINMGLGGNNQVVIANGNRAGFSNIVNAVMFRAGAIVDYGLNRQAVSSVNVTGTETVYLYGNVATDEAFLLDSPEDNIITGAPTYAEETAAPGTPQFYLDVAASFNHVSARRYYFNVTDRAYFYGTVASDSYHGDPISFTVTFNFTGFGSSGQATTVDAFNCDSAVFYDYGAGFGSFTASAGATTFSGGPNVFYCFTTGFPSVSDAYMSGVMGVVPGHHYFNEVLNVQGGTATGNGPGSGDTAYVFDAAHFTVSGFPVVITM